MRQFEKSNDRIDKFDHAYQESFRLSVPLKPKITIIGGGLSGLATAVKLRQYLPDSDITIFEQSSRFGGVIHSEKIGSYLVDHGADMFATNPPAAIDLCEQLGVLDDLMEPQVIGRGARIVKDSKLIPLPEGFVLMRATQLWPMLTTPLLSISGKLRFLAERWISRQSNSGQQSSVDESVSDFVTRRMGKQMLDRIVAPLAAGIYTADIRKLSMLATMGPIAKMERTHGSLAKATAARRKSGEDSVERSSAGARYSQFRAFRGGMVQLVDALAKQLPDDSLHTNTELKEFTRITNGWSLKLSDRTAECNELVIATPPHVASRLLESHAPEAADQLRQIEASSVAIVVIGVPRSQISKPVETFGFVVPLAENRKILACSFASAKFTGRAEKDRILMRVFVGGAMQPALLEKKDNELIHMVQKELGDLIGLTGSPEIARVIRWNKAMPQYHVGHLNRVETIDRAMNQIDGLSLVSNALHGVGISPLIAEAEKTARKIADRYASGNTSG
ncbi:protoporphyrinogen oxidase [bacterium]|nr:protoporphyrinogen oxidase [Rubripirellula sp.]MDB4338939.1 protoporphyrinogen oxidase [Rubripirellula sp.]MDB4676599.1 protoporphyrinogen oxidase [bacterium]